MNVKARVQGAAALDVAAIDVVFHAVRAKALVDATTSDDTVLRIEGVLAILASEDAATAGAALEVLARRARVARRPAGSGADLGFDDGALARRRETAPPLRRRWAAVDGVVAGCPKPLVSAEAVDDTILLVDTGRGIAEGLRNAAIPLQQVQTILFTNLLPVNTMGLDDLLFTGWLVPREKPIRIIGPPGTRKFVESLQIAYAGGASALGEALGLPADGIAIRVDEVSGEYQETIGGITIESVSLPSGPLPTLAWRFTHGEDEDAPRIVVSGSGWDREILTRFAANADVLIHEAAYLPTVEELEGSTGIAVENPERMELEAAFHTSILDVGDLASEAQVDRLVLVRLRPPPFFKLQVRSIVGNDYDGNIVVPDDGDVVFP